MLYAALSFAAVALAFAGTAVALAVKGSNHKAESLKQKAFAKEAQFRSDAFEEQLIDLNKLRGADKHELAAQREQIEELRTLLRAHAPDGVAADQFDKLLQKAKGSNGDGDEGSDSGDSVPR